jgi:DNA-binding GntR family transcriptional regulator
MYHKIMLTSINTKKPAALTNWTYGILKGKILNLEILPGEQMHIEKLTEILEVSKTPVREAFLKLASEGLIEVRPRVGYFVADITEQDIRDLFEIREIIETRAAKKAADLLSDEELEAMTNLLSESEMSVQNNDLQTFLIKEIEFHEFLQKHIQNKRLLALMDSINELTHRERLLSIKAVENIEQTLLEHRNILDGLIKRDPNMAEWFMGEHLHNVCERLVKFIKNNGISEKELSK